MLVLASASPRRQELLRNAGIAFAVQPTDIPEAPQEGELPRSFAERLAREKALAVASQQPGDFVLGADTTVVVDGQILGKPTDPADAARMLRLLSGRTHEVITGVCLVSAGRNCHAERSEASLPRSRVPAPVGILRSAQNDKTDFAVEDVRSETTLVTMNPLSEQDILFYIATGEPMDKAGAYAIQGIASRWIPHIEGDYCNVVGLPVALVCAMLREHGAI